MLPRAPDAEGAASPDTVVDMLQTIQVHSLLTRIPCLPWHCIPPQPQPHPQIPAQPRPSSDPSPSPNLQP